MSPRVHAGVTLLAGVACLLYVVRADSPVRESTTEERLSEFRRLQALLRSPHYDKEMRPNSWISKPTIVYINLLVISLGPVDQVNMEFTVDIFLRERWLEPRLRHNISGHISMHYNLYDFLWIPDTYILNEKRAVFHDMTIPNRMIHVFPNGTVIYSQRLTLVLSCDMKLSRFPMDNQTCRINMESYGYTTRDIIIQWHWERQIEKTNDMKLSEFTLTKTRTGDCSAVYSTGTYSCIFGDFLLDRQFNYYLVQTYIPTVLIVILSWVSFWIDETAVPARVTLGILTVLTMTSQSTVINQRLPRVSYIKAIDVWMSTCLMFVFGSLIEFSIVNVITRESMLVEKTHGMRNNIPDKEEESAVTPQKLDSSVIAYHHPSFVIEQPLIDINIPDLEFVETDREVNKKCCGRVNYCNRHRASLMDTVSRVLFPSLFVVFNIIYWIFYLTSSDKH